MEFAIYFDEDFVQMPDPFEEFAARNAPLAELRREHRPEPIPLEAHRLVRDINPALVEQILDIP